MIANKKIMVPLVAVLLIAIGAGMTLILANDRPVQEDSTFTSVESEVLDHDPIPDSNPLTNADSEVANHDHAQDVGTSTNSESEVEKPIHKHGDYDNGAIPVVAFDMGNYDLPTLPESLMEEFYEALLVLPSEDVYAEYFSWDDIDKDGDIKEKKVRELIAYAKAMAS